MARKIACEYLNADERLDWVEVQLAYSIGLRQPLSICINSSRGELNPGNDLYARCEPHRIINELGLLDVKYEPLAMFGHFA